MSDSVKRAWRYHAQYEAKIFEGEAIEIAERAGWVDSPAKIEVNTDADAKSNQDIKVGDEQEAPNQDLTDEENDLESLTVKELKKLCRDRGLKGYSRMKEAELIALIQG